MKILALQYAQTKPIKTKEKISAKAAIPAALVAQENIQTIAPLAVEILAYSQIAALSNALINTSQNLMNARAAIHLA